MEAFEAFRKNYKKLFKENKYKLTALFPDSFLKEHTDFTSLKDMIAQSRLPIKSMDDIDRYEQQWEDFVLGHCFYANWQALVCAATEAMRRRLRLEEDLCRNQLAVKLPSDSDDDTTANTTNTKDSHSPGITDAGYDDIDDDIDDDPE